MRIAISTVWLLAVLACGLFLISLDNSAGPQAMAGMEFPKVQEVQLDSHRCTLLLFAHPKCPCTRATIGELNRLLTRCTTNVAVHVFFLRPSTETEDWSQTDLWRSAGSIPGVQVHLDTDGAIAATFGASTSGDAVLYSSHGKLLFHGGITAGRGHEGDNPGASAIVAFATGTTATFNQTPAYGCQLQKQCNVAQETTQ
ncbi:MAG: hypothetical protein JWO95_3345 [Verrucomicrobiales bacterium]|nr:hypothetical protein [Verrucomicrobiales bacterium]